MDAQTFLREFGHIASAPDGIKKLRDLVLHLAVSGRLSNHGSGTADGLIKKINEKKAKLIASKKIKINKKVTPVPSDIPFKVPSNWKWVRFGEICHFSAGKTPPRKEGVYWNGDGYPWFSIADMVHQGTIISSSEFVTEEAKTKVFKSDPVKAGTLIMSFKLTIGRLSRLGVDAYHNEAIISIFPFAESLDEYLLKCLNGFDLTSGNKQAIKGNTLNQDSLSNILIALPPEKEIAEVVQKVDELMALCDQLEQQQQKKRSLQNQLRKATLDAVATATSPFELKQHWRRLDAHFDSLFSQPEDVEELRSCLSGLVVTGRMCEKSAKTDKLDLETLISELKKNKNGRVFAKKRYPEELYSIPDGWTWVRMEDLLSGSESGWSPKCHAEPRDGADWGVLKVSSVTWGSFNENENKKLPSSLSPRVEAEVKKGDFLLSRANTAELVARSVLLGEDTPSHLMMSDKIVRLVFTDERIKPWVNLVNNSLYSRSYYSENATGTSDSMRNVSRQVMHELPVPLPPLRLQISMLNKYKELIGICLSYEDLLQRKGKKSQMLVSSIIQSFTGAKNLKEEEPMKKPSFKLKATIKLGEVSPSGKANSPLASLLSRANGEIQAKDLWQRSGMDIDKFYAQLKTEVAHGWLAEPEVATMNIIEETSDE